MKKWTPSIIIWKLDLEEKGNGEYFQSLYFITQRGVKRFLKNHKKEIEEQDLSWSWGGEQLWFW